MPGAVVFQRGYEGTVQMALSRLENRITPTFLNNKFTFTDYEFASLSLSGTLSVTGAVTFTDTLDVTGATILSDTLDVGGVATFSDALSVASDLTVSGTSILAGATVSSDLTVASDLRVNGRIGIGIAPSAALDVRDSVAKSNVFIGGDGIANSNKATIYGGGGDTLEFGTHATAAFEISTAGLTTFSHKVTVSSDLAVSSDTVLSGTLGVTGLTTLSSKLTINSDLYVKSDTTLAGTLSVTGTSTLTAKLTVNSDVAIASDLAVSGTSTLAGITVSSDLVVASDIVVSGLVDGVDISAWVNQDVSTDATVTFDNMTLSQDLYVFGLLEASYLSLSHDLAISQTLAVSGTSVFSDKVTISSDLAVTSDTVLSGTLGVTGLTTLTAKLTVNSDLYVKSDATFAGALGVTGTSTLAGVTISSDLTVTSDIVVSGLVDGVDIAALKSDVDGFSDELKNLTTSEIQQVENLSDTTVSSAQWAYLGAFDQPLTTGSPVSFTGLTSTSDLAVTSDTTLSGTLGVTGLTTLTAKLTVNSDLYVKSDTTLAGTLGVTGTSTLAGVTVSSDLTVASDVTISGNISGANLDISGDHINIATLKTPASATDSGTRGDICWNTDYMFVCVATDKWERAAISTW